MIRAPLRRVRLKAGSKRGWHQTKADPLLELWGQVVKTRDRHICQRCGKFGEGRGFHAAHIFSRGKPASRYELSNGVTLCAACHKWAHSETSRFHAWAAERIGIEAYQRLLVRSNLSGQKNDPVVVKAHLMARLREMEGET